MEEEIKKGLCIKCRELKILNSKNICIFCQTHKNFTGIEVKNPVNTNVHGKEVKSITGSIKAGYADNAWMNPKTS